MSRALLIVLLPAFLGLLPHAQAQTNTAYGNGALVSLTSGVWNSGFGFEALNHDTAGKNNTATGLRSLFSDTSGSNNTANGVYALYGNINGWYNNAVGAFALANNISGNYNTANGYAALYRNDAYDNTATGYGALYHNTTGFNNTANGGFALFDNIAGSGNTVDGASALGSNTTGNQNTAIGLGALVSNTFGNNNTAIAYQALIANTTGTSNTALGYAAGNNVTTANNVICIGAQGANVSDTCYIGEIFGATSSGGTAVFINSNGRLGTATSSRRFKEEVKPMKQASEALFALKPVTFRYKKAIDPQSIPQFGLVAEEVEAVNSDLVVRDKEGKANTVRYEVVNAMLLNEFLKEHRKVQEQEATITELKKDFRATVAELNARLKEQDSKIEKVSAQLDVSRSAPQMVSQP